MRNLIIALLVVSVGFNVYLAVQKGQIPFASALTGANEVAEEETETTVVPETTTAEETSVTFFQREGNTWILYTLTGEGKEKTGLRVAVEPNKEAQGQTEQMYATISPDGKKVAYMQKPAWPHQIHVANIDGSQTKELIAWGEDLTPTHASIENQFVWSADSTTVSYAISNENCFRDEGTVSTNIISESIVSGDEKKVTTMNNSCTDHSNGANTVLLK
ncbi:hypothetical protein KKG22_01220 [Patescibacteria group bacterium]|nr:hypothetical protein [Patescibacteria group bacterium]MBU1722055.1 hypothetical protein [Patescibacteria group bacterium]MBU1901525.1 hypothetical protein [Patescibacteria group bacterium]